jgi:hypothetical protein
MSKTTNKSAPEVRARAVRTFLDHESDHPRWWAAITSIPAEIGCSWHTLLDWAIHDRRPVHRGGLYLPQRPRQPACLDQAYQAPRPSRDRAVGRQYRHSYDNALNDTPIAA